jgi:hypothetical protein
MHTDHSQNAPARRVLLIALAGLALVAIGVAVAIATNGGRLISTRQAQVAERGAQVMPFDLERTTHVFEKLPDGGLQTVRADDPADTAQVQLIQAHLASEAERFRQGDFSDPAAIHGHAMPGLAELRAGANRIDVRYSALSDGAQIRYTTGDPALIESLHHWFDAQLMDHGTDASDH